MCKTLEGLFLFPAMHSRSSFCISMLYVLRPRLFFSPNWLQEKRVLHGQIFFGCLSGSGRTLHLSADTSSSLWCSMTWCFLCFVAVGSFLPLFGSHDCFLPVSTSSISSHDSTVRTAARHSCSKSILMYSSWLVNHNWDLTENVFSRVLKVVANSSMGLMIELIRDNRWVMESLWL